jgi:hypothetical protein
MALWSMEREAFGAGRPILLWEFLETGAAELACAAIELLSSQDLGDDLVVAVVPPVVLERLPEAYGLALEMARDDRGRWTLRRFRGGRPTLLLGPHPGGTAHSG